MENNFCVDTDAYKLTHHLQYPKGTRRIYSYCESRIGSVYQKVRFFGLQMILMDHFVGQVISEEKVKEAKELSKEWFGTDAYFNEDMWMRIVKHHDGKLPLEIKAVPEGTLLPIDNVLFTIDCTDPYCYPLVNHAETLLMHIWHPTTVATQSWHIREMLRHLVEESGTLSILPYMVHDFGYRGVECQQAAARAGAAHLINFVGSDTNVADRALRHFYGKGRLQSVWATEHSVATTYGPDQGELEYVKAQLDRAPKDMIVSLVGDSYDIYKFCSDVIGHPTIIERIINRPGRVVVRPDSGDPEVVVGRCLNILESIFGSTYNEKGYKVLNHNVGLLQGDGMDAYSIPALYQSLLNNKWSTDNLVVGSGGGLLQKVNRDTQRFAIKASYGQKECGIEGGHGIAVEGFNIQKDPATSPNKRSKTGRLKLQKSISYITLSSANTANPALFESYADELVTVFKDGNLTKRYSLDEILSNEH